ncbi:MAG TPA: type VI secretion system contractile sheath small subunit [Candidatus Angelobacter sp.]|nr:type VI secretion system contractile sheath small subunit [Candidatus Angelobacter sp.]
MAKESVQQKLARVRAPRVHITYDVEIGDAIELKELPFVMGVLGDFTGQPKEQLPRLGDRKFVEVTPDNFDQVLEKMTPHVAFSVPNRLTDSPDAGDIKVDLSFRELADFDPEQVARQVKPLRELLDLRTKLADLRGSLQGNDRLDEMLHEIVNNTEKRQKLSGELGLNQGTGGKDNG